MRHLRIVVAAAVATAVPSIAVMGTAHAKPTPPRAELVAKGVTGSLSNGQVTVGGTVKNKGSKKAKASQAAFYLSTDGTASNNDTALGTVAVGKIKPKKAKPVAGVFALPTHLTAGTYRVLACADSGNQVKERKETNNCKASKGSITVAPTLVTISWSVANNVGGDTFGFVTATATGGTCTPNGKTGSCTVGSGAGTVTLTAGGASPPFVIFNGWTPAAGAACTGVMSGPSNEVLTFTNPTSAQGCVANFNFFI